MRVSTQAEVLLDHKAFRIDHVGRATQARYLVSSDRPQATLLDHALRPLATYRLKEVGDLNSAVLSPTRPLACFAGASGASLADLTGRTLSTRDAPNASARFAPDGSRVWLARRASADHVTIEVLAIEGNRFARQPEAAVTIDDPYGDSALVWQDLPDDDRTWLLLLAGQDGGAAFEIVCTKAGLRVTDRSKEAGCGPFSFGIGPEVLAVDSDAGVARRLSWPDLQTLGTFRYPDDGEALGWIALHLDAAHAVIEYRELQWCLDLGTMETTGPFIIAGHEARPLREIYPNLEDDDLATGIFLLQAAGDVIAGAFIGPDGQQNGVLLAERAPQ